MKIHAIILARGGSKGIKNKNLKLINKKPLIYYSILKSLKSKKINYTWVSSDSNKILRYSKKNGAKTIKRPAKYALDRSSSEDACKHAIQFIENQKYKIDLITLIQPTSPIRESSDFDRAIELLIRKKYDSLFTSTRINDFFTWEVKKKKLTANYNYKKRKRRQEIKGKIIENGSFYVFKKKNFLINHNRLFGKIGTFIMEKKKGFQIDDKIDIKIINSLFN